MRNFDRKYFLVKPSGHSLVNQCIKTCSWVTFYSISIGVSDVFLALETIIIGLHDVITAKTHETRRFAILDGPTMPIIGEGDEEPNERCAEHNSRPFFGVVYISDTGHTYDFREYMVSSFKCVVVMTTLGLRRCTSK